MRKYLFLFVAFIVCSAHAQEKPFKDMAENTAMYVQSVEHQPSLKQNKRFFKAFSHREDKLVKEVKGKELPVRLSASTAYKVLGNARIVDVMMGAKPSFKLVLDLELQNASGAQAFWNSDLKAVAYNEHGFAVAVGMFCRHIADDAFSELVVVTDPDEIARSEKKMYSEKRVAADISLTMTPWNAREFGNITRIQIVNANYPEILTVKKRDKQWEDLFKAGRRYTNKRLRVNILGGPKVMPFMGVDLRCDMNDFIAAMQNKGLSFSEPIGGYCLFSTTVTTQIDGRRADIIAYASPTTHIVAWVNYTEEGFKSKESAIQRLNQLRNKKIDELGYNFIIDGDTYVWRYGYVSFECKEFNIPNHPRSWYIVINVYDHPAYCPYKREFYKCLKEQKQQPSIPKEPSDIIEDEIPDTPTIGDPQLPTETKKKGSEKPDTVSPSRPVPPPPPPPDEETKIGVVWNPTLLELCSHAMRNNDIEKIQEDLTTTGRFRLSKELFGSGMEGRSSKYPDCDVLVKRKSKKSKELKLLKATIRKKSINSIREELEHLGYKIAEREKSDLESFHYYYYAKGNIHVEIEEVTAHEYELSHCSFTFRE